MAMQQGKAERERSRERLTNNPKVSPIKSQATRAVYTKHASTDSAITIARSATGARYRRDNLGGDVHLADTKGQGLTEVEVIPCNEIKRGE